MSESNPQQNTFTYRIGMAWWLWRGGTKAVDAWVLARTWRRPGT